jgi:putative oxidoreductase
MSDSTAAARPADYGIAAIRIMVGVVFLAHGYAKLADGLPVTAEFFASVGIPAPLIAAGLATAAETLGGLALVLGLGVRWAAAPLAFTMAVAVATVHLRSGFFGPEGFEFPLTLLIASVGLALTGPGAFALESVLSRFSAEHVGGIDPRGAPGRQHAG